MVEVEVIDFNPLVTIIFCTFHFMSASVRSKPLYKNSKRQKLFNLLSNAPSVKQVPGVTEVASIVVRFESRDGESTVCFPSFFFFPQGPSLSVPVNSTPKQLEGLVNQLLNNDEPNPYSLFIKQLKDVAEGNKKRVDDQKEKFESIEIVSTLEESMQAMGLTMETDVVITYTPQSVFRVMPVTRQMAEMSGHAEAVLVVAFTADGNFLASASGDASVRVWDVFTNTPVHVLEGHTQWVLALAWHPYEMKLVSTGMDKSVRVWDADSGKCLLSKKVHTDYVTCCVWEPVHFTGISERVATAGKDAAIRIWNTRTQTCELTLGSHTDKVTALKWAGNGFLLSASFDRSIKVWNTTNGAMIRTLNGHAHWVTCLALNTDYVLRTPLHDEKGSLCDLANVSECKETAGKRYASVLTKNSQELLVSGSDDFTLFIWNLKDSKPIIRLTGHQQPISHIMFSPDGQHIASGSFDRSIRIWTAEGKSRYAFRSHVESVYQVAWSPDSRLVVSASKDSTLKLWELKSGKRVLELPGHADEVYAVDWSPNGERVASGSKDHMIKIWAK